MPREAVVLLAGLDASTHREAAAALRGDWQIVEANDTLQAENAVREHPFPVILLDLEIPNGNDLPANSPAGAGNKNCINALEIIKEALSRHRATSIIALVHPERRDEAFSA